MNAESSMEGKKPSAGIPHSSFRIHHSTESVMPYFPNTESDRQAMLEAIGAASIDDLFAMIPADLRLKRGLCVPPGLGELELTAHLTALASQNTPATQAAC